MLPECLRAGGRTLVLAVALATMLPVWLTRVVPTQDGPSHLYNAWVVAHLRDPGLGLEQHFGVVPLAPNWGGIAPLVPLLYVLPAGAAEQVLLSGLLLALVLASAALARGFDGDPLLVALVAGVIGHGFVFVMGFTAFQAALAGGLALGAWARRPGDPASRGRVGAAAAVLGALFFVHLAGALLAAALWMLAGFAGRRPDIRRAVRLAAAGAPLCGMVGLHLLSRLGQPSPVYRPDSRGPLTRLLDLASGNYWEGFSTQDRAIGIGLALLLASLVALRLACPGQRTGLRLLPLAGAGCMAAYLLLPWALAGGAFVPDRIVPLLVLLPAIWTTAGQPPRRWPRVAAALLLLGALGLRTIQYRHWGDAQLRLTAQVPSLPRGAVAHVVQRPGLEAAIDPLTHLWARVALRDGLVALDDYEAALPGLFPVTFRPATLRLAQQARRGETPPSVLAFGWR